MPASAKLLLKSEQLWISDRFARCTALQSKRMLQEVRGLSMKTTNQEVDKEEES